MLVTIPLLDLIVGCDSHVRILLAVSVRSFRTITLSLGSGSWNSSNTRREGAHFLSAEQPRVDNERVEKSPNLDRTHHILLF